MSTRTLDVILAFQNFTDVNRKGGKKTEVSIMCCGKIHCGGEDSSPSLQGRSLSNSRRKTTRKNKGGFI